MKYGKAVGKKIIAINKQDFDFLMSHMIAFAQGNNMRMDYEPLQDDGLYFNHDADGYRHKFTFEPMRWIDNATANLLCDGQKTKTLRILSPYIPAIAITLTHDHGLTEDTNEWVDQYHFFASTSSLQEREYRRKTWECFSGYKSFDYDTDIEEIVSSIESTLQQIVDAYLPLFQ
jgi:hypothetical protein